MTIESSTWENTQKLKLEQKPSYNNIEMELLFSIN